MTDYTDEYMVQEMLRRAQETDRQLERWGWFRAVPEASGRRGLGLWIGEGLVRVGLWIRGAETSKPPNTKSAAANGERT
jgi:hypothetical protein